jgi:hypothetical protein
VLRGETVESDLEYACPSPSVGRWFIVRVSSVPADPPGALVTHVNITRRKAAEDDLLHRASSDPLTGLANRTALEQRLRRALTPRAGRTPSPDVGVLCLDLDGFKPVNDTFGHAAGDEVLQVVAHRLLGVVRPQDTVARLGGDEFAGGRAAGERARPHGAGRPAHRGARRPPRGARHAAAGACQHRRRPGHRRGGAGRGAGPGRRGHVRREAGALGGRA